MEFDSVIVGGGVTGLALGYRLMMNGRQTMVIEAERAGGVVRSTHRDGFNLELGPNVFVEKPALMELLKQLGLESSINFAPAGYRQMIWRSGKMVPAPKDISSLLRSPLMSPLDKLLLPARVMRKGGIRPREEDESIAQFLSRGIGRSAIKNMVAPMLQGIFGGDVDKLSARSIMPEIWRHGIEEKNLISYAKGRPKPRVFTLGGGAESLTGTLGENLRGNARVQIGKVARIRRGPGGANRFETQLENGEKILSHKVFLATSGPASAEVLGDLSPELAAELGALRYAPLAVVHLGIERREKVPENTFGVLFPPGDSTALLGIMFNSVLFPKTAAAGSHLLTLCFGGIGREAILNQTDADFEAAAKAAVLSVLGAANANLLSVHRWPRAIPQYEVGHFNLVRKMKECESKFPGLRFVGADAGGIGVPDRVRAAYEVEI